MKVYMLTTFNLETTKTETELYQTKASAIKQMKKFGELTRLLIDDDEVYMTIRNGKYQLWKLAHRKSRSKL